MLFAVMLCIRLRSNLPPDKELWAVNGWGEAQDNSYESTFGGIYLSYKVWKDSLHSIMNAWHTWRVIVETGTVRYLQLEGTENQGNHYWNSAAVGGYGGKISGGYVAGYKDMMYNIIYDTL